MLNAGQQVILVKAAKGPYPISYSLVTRYEGDNIWRTPFEADSPEEVYDFDIWHYTFSKDLWTNPRVSIYWVAEAHYDEDYDDDDYEEDEYDTEEAPVVRRNVPTNVSRPDYKDVKIKELEQQIWVLQHKELINQLNNVAQATLPSRKWRRRRVSI